MPKPRVAISACLLGEAVRWDGQEKRAPALLAALGPHVEWVPVCPEVGAGFGVPREPIHLERVGDRVRVLSNETRRDVTPALDAFADHEIARLRGLGVCGLVLKSRSPSCGLYDTPIAEAGDMPALGAGHFAFCATGAEPTLPFADENELGDAAACAQFLDRVRAMAGRAG